MDYVLLHGIECRIIGSFSDRCCRLLALSRFCHRGPSLCLCLHPLGFRDLGRVRTLHLTLHPVDEHADLPLVRLQCIALEREALMDTHA